MEHCFLSSLRVNAASEMFGLEFGKIVSFQISLGSVDLRRVGSAVWSNFVFFFNTSQDFLLAWGWEDDE